MLIWLINIGCLSISLNEVKGTWKQQDFEVQGELGNVFEQTLTGLQFNYVLGEEVQNPIQRDAFAGYTDELITSWSQNIWEGCEHNSTLLFSCFAPMIMAQYPAWSEDFWQNFSEQVSAETSLCEPIESNSFFGYTEGILVSSTEIFVVSYVDFYCEQPTAEYIEGDFEITSMLLKQ